MNIGLVGWDVATGLGRYNLDLARHLGVCKWLVPQHRDYPAPSTPPLAVCTRVPLRPDRGRLLEFLDGLDWLLLVETPYVPELPVLARERGVRIAAVPMRENFDPRFPWVALVDLMLPPTRQCEEVLLSARRLGGFSWQVERVPGSVDTERLPFRIRDVCRRFVFINGRGGYAGRKGVQCVAEAARLAPEVRVLLYSQTRELPPLPANVEVRPAVEQPEELYAEGEVSVQPSRWEGIGLSLLEAQACGLPLVTSHGPPMAEYEPYRLVDAAVSTVVIGGLPVPVYDARPDHLAAILRALVLTDVSRASRAARQFVEEHHSWQANAPRLKGLLESNPARSAPTGPRPEGAAPRPNKTAADANDVSSPKPYVQERFSRNPAAVRLMALITREARQVLDIGCRSGELGLALGERQSAEVIGIEADVAEARIAAARLARVLTGEVERLRPDFPEHAFDAIVCRNALQAACDPAWLLRQVRRWLRPGGQFLLDVPNARHHSVVASLLGGRWAAGQPAPPQSLRFFTRREVEKLCYRAGFNVDSIHPVGDSDLDAWQRRGRPRQVQVGGLQIEAASDAEAEEFYATGLLFSARPVALATYGITSIVIVTHNQVAFTRVCLDSIRLRTDEPYELIVVDNASTDGTLDYLRSVRGITVLTNPDNRGFPAAANQGIRAAIGKQILLLNNDTVVTTGWLRRLLRALGSDSKIGLVGPCSNFVSGEQQVQVEYGTDLASLDGFAWEWGRAHDGSTQETDRLIGFCLVIRREVMDRIGLLDERFGLGCYEDDDYCRRALRAGFRAVIARDSFVHHFGGRTFVGAGVNFAALMNRNEQLFREKWRAEGAADVLSPPRERAQTYSVRAAAGGGLLLGRSTVLISLCMIVRNSARTITACLESIKPWVDEMVVVDTGSTDRTPQIVERLGARLFHSPWRDSFAAARNESVGHARGQWVFWMDSDDTIDERNGRALRELAAREVPPSLLGYVVQVHCPGPGEDGMLDVTVVDHVKLFRNVPTLRFEGRVHEQILPAIRRAGGEVAWSDVFVVHSGYDHSPEGQRKKIERDLHLLQLELAEQPDHPFTRFNLGMTYADVGEFDKAIEHLRQSIARSAQGESHLRKAHALLTYCLNRSGRPADAREACGRALREFPDDLELRFRHGLLLHEAGRLEDSAAVYRQVLDGETERHFTSVDRGLRGFKTRQNLAVVYSELGRHKEAEEQWRHVVSEVPQYRAGWRGLGESLLAQGKVTEAGELASRMEREKSLRCDGLILGAHVLVAKRHIDPARRTLEQAVRDFPDDAAALQALCQFLFEHAGPGEAEPTLREMVRRCPQDAAAHHNLGAAWSQQGRLREAVDAFRQSLLLRPQAPNTLWQLGNALDRSGRREDAVRAWRAVLQLQPDHSGAQEALRR